MKKVYRVIKVAVGSRYTPHDIYYIQQRILFFFWKMVPKYKGSKNFQMLTKTEAVNVMHRKMGQDQRLAQRRKAYRNPQVVAVSE